MSNPKREINQDLRRIVGQCHVNKSNRYVINHVISKLKGKKKAFFKMKKEDRREFMRQCIYVHGENFILYCVVMSGMSPKEMDDKEIENGCR